jgi:hypothetical protein
MVDDGVVVDPPRRLNIFLLLLDGDDEKNDADDRIDLPTKEEERELVKAREPRSRTILVVVAMSMDSEDRILVWLGGCDAFLDFLSGSRGQQKPLLRQQQQ